MNEIILGDCIDVMETMPDNSVDLVLTDPPYAMPAASHKSAYKKYHRSLADMSVLESYFKQYFRSLKRIAKPDSTYYTFCNADSYPVFYRASKETVNACRTVIWYKTYVRQGHTWRHQHEIILWNTRENTKPIYTADCDVLQYKTASDTNRLHPIEKPTALLRRLIAKHPKAKVVFDPFCGSGSTLVAAKELGRDYYGIELDETYHALATERVEKTIPLTTHSAITQEKLT